MVQAAFSQVSRQIGQRSSKAMAHAAVGWGELRGGRAPPLQCGSSGCPARREATVTGWPGEGGKRSPGASRGKRAAPQGDAPAHSSPLPWCAHLLRAPADRPWQGHGQARSGSGGGRRELQPPVARAQAQQRGRGWRRTPRLAALRWSEGVSWRGQAGARIPAVMSQCIAATCSVPRVFCGVLGLGASRQPPRTWPWHPGALLGHCGPGWQTSPGTHSGRVPEEPGTRRRSQSTALTSAEPGGCPRSASGQCLV